MTCNESKEEEENMVRWCLALHQLNTSAARKGVWALVSEEVNTSSAHAHFTEMCSGSEAGSYLRLIDFCGHMPRIKWSWGQI